MKRVLGTPLILCVVFAASVGCPHAHDHPHAEESDQQQELEPIARTLFTERLCVFSENEPIVRGQEVRFLVHVTLLENGAPLRSGTVTLEARTDGGAPVVLNVDAPKRDGLFIPTGTFDAPGRYATRLAVTGPGFAESLDFGELVVHDSEPAARASPEGDGAAAPSDTVQFLLEHQWKIGMLTEKASRHDLVERLKVSGRVQAEHGASAEVVPPVAGSIAPPPGGELPHLGQRVEAGQLLGTIEAPLDPSLAMERLMRNIDLDVKTAELERAVAQVRARLAHAERTLERTAALHDKGLASAQQKDDAERDVSLARSELEGSANLMQAYQRASARLEALSASASENNDSPLLRLPLVAPLTGTLVMAECIEGQRFAVDDVIFRIVDVSTVWVEARIPEFDVPRLADPPGALLSVPGPDAPLLDLTGSAGGDLVFSGAVVDPTTHTLSLLYEVPNPDGRLRIGMAVDVYLETRREVDAVAIPVDAVVMEGGHPMAYVLLEGETFQRRELVLGVRDGDYVAVHAGVREGERVVSVGAYDMRLAALEPASMGHSHVH